MFVPHIVKNIFYARKLLFTPVAMKRGRPDPAKRWVHGRRQGQEHGGVRGAERHFPSDRLQVFQRPWQRPPVDPRAYRKGAGTLRLSPEHLCGKPEQEADEEYRNRRSHTSPTPSLRRSRGISSGAASMPDSGRSCSVHMANRSSRTISSTACARSSPPASCWRRWVAVRTVTWSKNSAATCPRSCSTAISKASAKPS